MADEIYARFEELRNKRNVSVYAVSKATGITTTTFTNWKKGKYVPKRNKMQLIADYFNVTLDYLMEGKEKTFTESQAEIDIELAMQSEEIKKYMLKFANLPEEKRNQIMSLIDMIDNK